MVAVIKIGHFMQHIYDCNKNKLEEGIEECISEMHYLIDTNKLLFNQKLNRLLKQVDLNDKQIEKVKV